LVTPRRDWPVILIGVTVVAPLVATLVGLPPLVAVTWGVGMLVRTVVTAVPGERWVATGLGSIRAVLAFVAAAFLGSLTSTLVVVAVTVVRPLDNRLGVLQLAGDWFSGDALGIVVLVPIALVALGRIPRARLLGAEGITALACV